jgi:hypothetical protein
MWKEMAMDDDGNLLPIDPHHDPMQYEFPVNFIFDTVAEADAWLRDDADDWGISPEESDDWVLVKYTETIMPQGVNP